ncbi:hypothetical protein JTB14_002317 [Gonioctena quinquepunctata]|nr:hypothetical protein JTB14_002317 [Gonioctena quinquepunctata]
MIPNTKENHITFNKKVITGNMNRLTTFHGLSSVEEIMGKFKKHVENVTTRWQDIFNVEFLPIDENAALKLAANCEKYNNPVCKPIDYTKLKKFSKEFNKEDLHMVLRKSVHPYE